ncbi:copper chaperone PCu(A)C [Marinospirillum sp. MEB164]|uniref:Copper chaperone PCu(A)C n=1 Tax=Marinospirillum alkalitolerans TaxID=3123374 RepID=A0ABW8PVA7_9GAMM
MPRFIVLLASLLVLFSAAASAHDFRLGELRLVHPFATPTPPTAAVGAVYLDIDHQGSTPRRLISARAHIAEVVELHDMSMHDGVMQMRQLEVIALPAGEVTRMRPGGGYHLMLIGLKQPLVAGERFPLWLTFADLGEIRVEVWVESAAQGGAAADAHHHHHH